MLIAGEWCDAEDGGTGDVLNPATGEIIATVPKATIADVDRCVACLLYTSPSPRDKRQSRMPSSA